MLIAGVATSHVQYEVFLVADLIIVLLISGCTIILLAHRVARYKGLAGENAMFRDMVDLVKEVAITVHDLADGGRVLYANDAACKHFGVSREILLTWRPTNWSPRLDATVVEALYGALNSEGTQVFETVHRVASGDLVPVEVMQLCQVRDGIRLVIAYTRDIRVRKAKEAQRLQREIEQAGWRRLSRFVASIPGFLFTVVQRTDRSSAMPFASSGIRDIYGLRPEDVENDISRLAAARYPEDNEKIFAAMAESARNLSPYDLEFRVNHPEKGEIWVEARAVPQREPDGNIVWHGFMYDITKRKQAEIMLLQREREFRSLAESLPDNIVRWDIEGRYFYVNSVHERTLTTSIGDLLGKRLSEAFPDGRFASVEAAIGEVLATGRAARFVRQLVPVENEEVQIHDVSLMPERNVDGEVVAVLGIWHNMTDLYRLQDDLAAREREFRSLAEHIPDPVYRYDSHCRRIYVNSAVGKIIGKPVEELIGRTPADGAILVSEQNRKLMECIRSVFASGDTDEIDLEFAAPDGERSDYQMLLVPEFAANREVATVLAIARDITKRMRIERLLRDREQEFRMLSDNSPDVIVRYDRECRRLYVNPAYQAATGSSAASILGKTPLESWALVTMPAAVFQSMLQSVLENGEMFEIELEGKRPDGASVNLSMTAVAERNADGRIISVLTISRDITTIKQAQESLKKREQEFRALVENSPDTIARYDRDCLCVYANPRLVTDLVGDPARILGKTPAQFPGGASALVYGNMLREVMEQGEERSFELRWQIDGTGYCSQIRMMPEFDLDGQVEHVLAVGRDISEIDRYRQEIHQHAFFDNLTGLPNRQLLSDRISQTIADAAFYGHQFGLMLLDLDHFKEVNDTLGHSAGDCLLREAAKRMQQCVRAYDTVARLGGDEFFVLVPDMRRGDDLATIADKILRALAEPFVIDERELFVTASIGIALYPDDSTEIDALYKYADSAMYQAKKMGRNNFQFYAKELTARSLERMEVEMALRKAQKNCELALYYQPQIELQTGRITGAEALLRWNRPGHGVVTPDRFISIAEESGLIVDIGEWVLRTACMTVTDWNRERKIPVTLAVNLSTRQFMRSDLAGSVCRILSETGCKAEWLELEITESLLLEDSEGVTAMLEELHDMGLSLSIDDFGTGYSALSYLNRFPVSQIKIDRSFIKDIPNQRNKSELVKAMLSIAAALHLESVAEGVETSEQAQYLMAHGCQLAQGYLFGKPMPRMAFETMLASGYSLQDNLPHLKLPALG